MGKTTILWCDFTHNPWEGCSKVSPGCANCYALERDKRWHGGRHWGPGAPRRVTSPANWRKPLKWNRAAEKAGVRYRVFCGSLCDVFDPEAPEGARHWLWHLIQNTPNLDWLLLTKRPELIEFPPQLSPGIWLGTTIENQDEADRRIDLLLQHPAAFHFLSCEPLLGPVAIPERLIEGIDWCIVGGESGPKARPMRPAWARSLRDQCAEAGVAFLYKQTGAWAPCGPVEPDEDFHGDAAFESFSGGRTAVSVLMYHRNYRKVGDQVMERVGKKAAGRLLDGVEHTAFPEGGTA